MRRLIIAIGAVLLLITSACSNDEPAQPAAADRPACNESPPTMPPNPDIDQGPCILEIHTDEEEPWTLSGGWRKDAYEGTPGDGPCIFLELSTGHGAGWCDLPEARIIGEFTTAELSRFGNIAWGPTAAGKVDRVRIEFAGTVPFIVETKPTPWKEFDFWVVTFEKTRRPTALVALDANDKEIARETLHEPAPTTSPTPSVSPS